MFDAMHSEKLRCCVSNQILYEAAFATMYFIEAGPAAWTTSVAMHFIEGLSSAHVDSAPMHIIGAGPST